MTPTVPEHAKGTSLGFNATYYMKRFPKFEILLKFNIFIFF